MRIHNIYADESGETHFRDIDIEMTEHGPDGSTSGQAIRYRDLLPNNLCRLVL
jgi:hypothetical protein